MGIKTTNISVTSNVSDKNTNNWVKGNSNARISINNKISPTVALKKNSGISLTSNSSIGDKITSKLGGNISGITSELSKKIGMSTTISSVDNELFKSNMVHTISKQLTSPGLPINLKNELVRAINAVCGKGHSFGFNLSLLAALNGLGLGLLMKLITCLADHSKLASMAISMLDSGLSTHTLKSGLKGTLSSGKVNMHIASGIVNNKTGISILTTTPSLLSSINENTKSKINIDESTSNNMYNKLPKNKASMCIYSNKKEGLFSKLVDKKNKTKAKSTLSTSISPIADSTLNKLFMVNYSVDKHRATLRV